MDDGCEENLNLPRGPDEPGETWRAQSRIQLAVHSAKVWGHHCGVGFQVVCFPSEAPPARIYVYVGPPNTYLCIRWAPEVREKLSSETPHM